LAALPKAPHGSQSDIPFLTSFNNDIFSSYSSDRRKKLNGLRLMGLP
jgi:hypothetical protein